MQAPEGFRHATPLTVRFADLDVLGHLNHAKYLTYMEQARIRYVKDVCDWSGGWQTLGMILAKATIDYKLPVLYEDEAVVYTRCSRIGGKSFDLDYVLLRQTGDNAPEIAATCTTVMVAFNYEANTTVPVPDTWRERMTAYEPILSN